MYKKLFSILLAVSLVLALAVCVSAESSGSCGENAYWSYADGTLTITGTGAIDDYRVVIDGQDTVLDQPWKGYAQQIQRIVIGEGITRIGNQAFDWLTNVRSVSLPSTLTEIGDFAFIGCEALESVDLPEGLTSLGQQAFCGTGLTAVEIPGSVSYLGGGVFTECAELTDVFFRSDPDLPGYRLGNANFQSCPKLEQIRVEEGHICLKSIDGVLYFYWSSGELLLREYPMGKQDTDLRIADGTIEISQSAVYGNPWLKTVTLPDTVTSISSHAFASCFGLETVTFEGSAPEIGSGAFWGANLTIRYPAGDASWDARDQWSKEYLVGDMPNGKESSVTWESYVPQVGEGVCGDNAAWYYKNGKLTISGTGALYNYQSVIDITTDAPWSGFAEELTTLVIEDGITQIGQMNFRGLSKLDAVTLADSVTYIDNWAFWGCEALEAIDLPDGLTGIGQEAFQCCRGLRSIEIPGSVTFLGGCVFDNCTALTDAYFRSDPNLLSFMMGNSNFRGCSSLERIRVEEGHIGLRSIDGVLYFYWESGELLLHDYPMGKRDAILQVADGTIEIGQYAVGNPYLKKVTIPDSVTKVSTYAFADCYGLETVTFEGSAPEIGQGAFQGANLTIRYPMGDASWDAKDQWPKEYLVGNVGGRETGVTWESYDPSHIHEYSAVVTAPTCTGQGFTTHTCACGDSYTTDHTDALGHDFVNGTCARCGLVPNPFTDVPEGSFYYAPVLWAVEKGITSGTSDTTFSPGNACLRAQVVTFLWRAAGCPEPVSTNNPFVDVTESDFYYKAVLWAVEMGITNGTDATHFGPYGICNRAQVVTFLYRAFGDDIAADANNPFTDVDDSTWYAVPVLWAVEKGITNGLSATEFGPNAECNRAQIVTFLYRACG